MAPGMDADTTIRIHRLSSFREHDDDIVKEAKGANIGVYAQRARAGLPIFSEETTNRGGE